MNSSILVQKLKNIPTISLTFPFNVYLYNATHKLPFTNYQFPFQFSGTLLPIVHTNHFRLIASNLENFES